MILKDIRAILLNPVHMVLIPVSPYFFICSYSSHTWDTAALYETDAIELCHLYHHLSTRIPPRESRARQVFKNNGIGGLFIDVFESISQAQTQSLNGL